MVAYIPIAHDTVDIAHTAQTKGRLFFKLGAVAQKTFFDAFFIMHSRKTFSSSKQSEITPSRPADCAEKKAMSA